jgi:drug/metabolite transporter (DMT)-like permease
MSRPAGAEARDLSAPPPDAWRGYAAAGFAVVVWAGWIVATRDQVAGVASPLDLALLRYGLPALMLAPIWWRKGIIPKDQNVWLIVIMSAGWGGPFVLLTAQGLKTIPASLFGPMVPATLPLIVALWDLLVERAPITRDRALGLLFIAISIALIVGPAALRGDEGFFRGAPFLMAAACGWAAFTIAFRRTTLNGLEATAYTGLYSTPFLLLAALVFGSHLDEVPAAELAWLALSQGVLAGVGAVWGYGYALRHLGIPRTSSLTSLVPMGAALGGWAFLGEAPGATGWASVTFACLGVGLVNGAFAALIGRR